jgi:hypothetical protein
VVPLPWEYHGQHLADKAILPALLCVGLLGFFGWRGRWITFMVMVLVFLAVPAAVALIQWDQSAKALAPEQHYNWSGWYWIVPYTQGATFSSIDHIGGAEWNPLRSPFWWMLAWVALVVGRKCVMQAAGAAAQTTKPDVDFRDCNQATSEPGCHAGLG